MADEYMITGAASYLAEQRRMAEQRTLGAQHAAAVERAVARVRSMTPEELRATFEEACAPEGAPFDQRSGAEPSE